MGVINSEYLQLDELKEAMGKDCSSYIKFSDPVLTALLKTAKYHLATGKVNRPETLAAEYACYIAAGIHLERNREKKGWVEL